MSALPPFSLTPLINSPSAKLPKDFDPQMALILAQACELTYTQFQQPSATPTDLTPAELAGLNVASGPNKTDYNFNIIGDILTVSESLGLGFTSNDTGTFVTLPCGFAVHAAQISRNAPSINDPLLNIVAFRGTQTYQEWVNDAEAFPSFFSLDGTGESGMVHGGMYSLYLTGSDGSQPSDSNPRPQGSLAQQMDTLFTSGDWDRSLPVYFTGHSLGGALAIIAAMDAACNYSSYFKEIHMYSFAAPMVAAGVSIDWVGYNNPPSKFTKSFQKKVSSSYSVINAADIVPILPFSVSTSDFGLAFAQAARPDHMVTYCAQLQDIGYNHYLLDNYLPFVSSLAIPATSSGKSKT